jgi:hypothetical protein
MRVKLRGAFFIKDSCGRLKERRCMIADAHGMPMSFASAHLIAISWTSANAFRHSLALNVTRVPRRAKPKVRDQGSSRPEPGETPLQSSAHFGLRRAPPLLPRNQPQPSQKPAIPRPPPTSIPISSIQKSTILIRRSSIQPPLADPSPAQPVQRTFYSQRSHSFRHMRVDLRCFDISMPQ